MKHYHRKLSALLGYLAEPETWATADVTTTYLAAMCIADGVLDLAQVSIATLDRFVWHARSLTKTNVDDHVAYWSRQ